jgi:hypothetical protein
VIRILRTLLRQEIKHFWSPEWILCVPGPDLACFFGHASYLRSISGQVETRTSKANKFAFPFVFEVMIKQITPLLTN